MDTITRVEVGSIVIGGGAPLVLIAGPCVMESEAHTLQLAAAIDNICRRLQLPLIFKASFDKANRSSIDSFRGPGLQEGLRILARVRLELGVPILSDIHEADQAGAAGEVLDIVQIPAFLCRQTDLIIAAAQTGKVLNIKKGQFMAPEEMANTVSKAGQVGNRRVLLTERGTFFGYHRLVNDMTAIAKMQSYAPVIFDGTHSCQFPGGEGRMSGGQREYAPLLFRAAVAAGADALFLEVHDHPAAAKSDPATVWPLDQLEKLLTDCLRLRAALSK
ncbi:MAG: 2-dehydro-3-deoxyphosphooctonate aldolase [Phycisphaerae bacterium]|nr:2-dehydro-3-deoxyphosphooctonate aldolase [Phycisphaerae bacterium]